MNANEITNTTNIYASETETLPKVSLTTITNPSKTPPEPLRGAKLLKGYKWTLEKLEGLYGRYRVSREGDWMGVLGKLTVDQIKKTMSFLESGKSGYKIYAPTAAQFYELALQTDNKKTPEELAKQELRQKHLEEVRKMLWGYLLTKGKNSQSEATLGDFFHRTGIDIPQEIKNLVTGKIKPLNEEILLEMSKRYQFWMGSLPDWLYMGFE